MGHGGMGVVEPGARANSSSSPCSCRDPLTPRPRREGSERTPRLLDELAEPRHYLRNPSCHRALHGQRVLDGFVIEQQPCERLVHRVTPAPVLVRRHRNAIGLLDRNENNQIEELHRLARALDLRLDVLPVNEQVGEEISWTAIKERVVAGSFDLERCSVELRLEVLCGRRPFRLVAVLLEEVVRLFDACVQRQRLSHLLDQRRLPDPVAAGERDPHLRDCRELRGLAHVASSRFYETYCGFGARAAKRYDDGVLMLYNAAGFSLALGPSEEAIARGLGCISESIWTAARPVLAHRDRLVRAGVELVEEADEPAYVSVKCGDPGGYVVEASWEPRP